MSTRRATIRTEHEDAEAIAAALRPDNTDDMAMDVQGNRLTTTIERETTGGLLATVDDYVVNLSVACETRDTTTHE
jgi:hypothetical protein